jgi:hypothetical protein
MDMKVLDWAVTQGLGLFIAVLVLVFYRRDVMEVLSNWRGQTQILIGLVEKNTAAMQSMADAVKAMELSLPHACPMAERIADGTFDSVSRRAKQ